MALGVGSGRAQSRGGGAHGFQGRYKTRNRRGKSTRDLGKWQSFDTMQLTGKYIAWRRAHRQIERRSRSETHRRQR